MPKCRRCGGRINYEEHYSFVRKIEYYRCLLCGDHQFINVPTETDTQTICEEYKQQVSERKEKRKYIKKKKESVIVPIIPDVILSDKIIQRNLHTERLRKKELHSELRARIDILAKTLFQTL